MPSQKLASGENLLKGELAAAWNIFEGSSGDYTDLGIARRFGVSQSAYSLRDIGAMNGRVVNVRRDLAGEEADPEEDFSANQVSSGALENWVNGKLEDTLPADVDTAAAAYSLRKVKKTYSGKAVRIRRIDNTEVDVAFDSDGKVSTSSSITNVESGDVDDTAETTLGNFLQGEADVRALFNASSYNPSSGSDNFWRATTELDLGSGAMSFSCDFVVTGEFGSNTSRIVQKYDGATYFYWETSTSFRYKIDGTSGTTAISSSVTLQRGRKYNMEFSRDASNNTTLKINGVTVGTNTNTARNTGQILIGRIAGFRLEGVALNFNFNNGQHIYAGDGNETSNWVDTGTGGNNLSKEGSPVLFTGQGMDSFVHNWYDQAGSNNVVQGTAGSQPKIAENGALLADGLLFDGSDDVLVSTSFSATQPITTSAVFKSSNTSDSQTVIGGVSYNYIIHRAGGAATAGLNAGTLYAPFSSITSKQLMTTLANGTSSTVSQNGVISSTGDAGTNNQTDLGIGSNGNGSTAGSGSAKFDGSIEEVIVYDSDQSNNRFKIESNINNYYGLYNDANDMLTDWSDDPTAPYGSAFTSNGKDGYTVDYSAGVASTRARWQFENNVASGDTIYYSFNASITSGTPSIITKQADGTSNAQSNAVAISNGFNSGSITTNAEAVYFAIGDTEGTQNFTISDFRVSRIARNGFLETWYDQSSSGNNATQTTAGQQPKIVENGGIVKNVKGFPSVKFESANSTELDIGKLINNINSVSAYVVTQKDSGDTNRVAGFTQGVSNDNSRFYFPFYTTGTVPNLGYNNSAAKISFGSTLTGTCNLYSAFSGDTNIEAFKNGSSVGTTALVDQAVTATDSKIGQLSNSFRFDGVMSEIFLTTQKLQSDADTINKEVQSYYNL